MEDVHISRKKPPFPVTDELRKYLKNYERGIQLPISYDELRDFREAVPIVDQNGEHTLWESPIYHSSEIERIHHRLREVYALLKASGNLRVVEHKYIDKIEYCTFGNTHPFRVKIVNRLNDVYDYFYIKIADASRIYGMELEQILSPNQLNFIVGSDTLVEEHIPGIPGDMFIRKFIHNPDFNPKRIAKEFVKFNERCLITLLGDMRSYNFVMQVMPDFDDYQFRIRCIDFDQQCYEGNMKVYMPQFFKENFQFVKLGLDNLTEKTFLQYQQEEQSSILHRMRSGKRRLADLYAVVKQDHSVPMKNVVQLRAGMAEHFGDPQYLRCRHMADIIKHNLKRVVRNVRL